MKIQAAKMIDAAGPITLKMFAMSMVMGVASDGGGSAGAGQRSRRVHEDPGRGSVVVKATPRRTVRLPAAFSERRSIGRASCGLIVRSRQMLAPRSKVAITMLFARLQL